MGLKLRENPYRCFQVDYDGDFLRKKKTFCPENEISDSDIKFIGLISFDAIHMGSPARLTARHNPFEGIYVTVDELEDYVRRGLTTMGMDEDEAEEVVSCFKFRVDYLEGEEGVSTKVLLDRVLETYESAKKYAKEIESRVAELGYSNPHVVAFVDTDLYNHVDCVKFQIYFDKLPGMVKNKIRFKPFGNIVVMPGFEHIRKKEIFDPWREDIQDEDWVGNYGTSSYEEIPEDKPRLCIIVELSSYKKDDSSLYGFPIEDIKKKAEELGYVFISPSHDQVNRVLLRKNGHYYKCHVQHFMFGEDRVSSWRDYIGDELPDSEI